MIYRILDLITYSTFYRAGKPVCREAVIMSQDYPPYVKGQGAYDMPEAWPGPAWVKRRVGWVVEPLRAEESVK